MKKILVFSAIFIAILSVFVLSNLGTLSETVNNMYAITDSISLEQEEVCKTIFYEENVIEHGKCKINLCCTIHL